MILIRLDTLRFQQIVTFKDVDGDIIGTTEYVVNGGGIANIVPDKVSTGVDESKALVWYDITDWNGEGDYKIPANVVNADTFVVNKNVVLRAAAFGKNTVTFKYGTTSEEVEVVDGESVTNVPGWEKTGCEYLNKKVTNWYKEGEPGIYYTEAQLKEMAINEDVTFVGNYDEVSDTKADEEVTLIWDFSDYEGSDYADFINKSVSSGTVYQISENAVAVAPKYVKDSVKEVYVSKSDGILFDMRGEKAIAKWDSSTPENNNINVESPGIVYIPVPGIY